MKLKNKLIAGLSGLALAGATTVVGLDQACVFDDEVLKVKDQKICFQQEADYLKYRKDRVDKFKNHPKRELFSILAPVEDRNELEIIINHEIKKQQKIKVDNLTLEEIIKTLNL